MIPEEQARQEIDKQLAACGWTVQDHKAMNAVVEYNHIIFHNRTRP